MLIAGIIGGMSESDILTVLAFAFSAGGTLVKVRWLEKHVEELKEWRRDHGREIWAAVNTNSRAIAKLEGSRQ